MTRRQAVEWCRADEDVRLNCFKNPLAASLLAPLWCNYMGASETNESGQ